jgi:hypothetical protein
MQGINAFAAKAQAENPARPSFILCERGDSNPHDRSHWILSPARLPIPPLSHQASTVINNNALALSIIADAKSERIRLLCHNCQENTGSPAWSPSGDSRKSLAVCHFGRKEESHMYINGSCSQPGIRFDCAVDQPEFVRFGLNFQLDRP